MCCNEDDGEVDAVATAAALLSRPAINAMAASATEAVLPTTATLPPTTLYTYIYKYILVVHIHYTKSTLADECSKLKRVA